MLAIISQYFDNAPTKQFRLPVDTEADAISFATAVCDGQFQVFTPASTAGTKIPLGYSVITAICQNVVDGAVVNKAYLNFIVKPTASESDIQTALVGKTFNDGVTSFLIDRVGVSFKKIA